jgi:hypothetical protein
MDGGRPMELQDYVTTGKAGKMLGIGRKRAHTLASEPGSLKLPGCIFFEGRWLVPIAAVEARKAVQDAEKIPENCPHCGGKIR